MMARPELVSAYYVGAHEYTYVPNQVARDIDWMAGNCTDAVVLALFGILAG